ncbi:MAG: glutamine-hydrolyzing GMP synthase [Silvanigrellaceae bacterium]
MILIIDFGSQYTEVLHRVVREQGIEVEVVAAHDKLYADHCNNKNLSGIILSGGPQSVYGQNAPTIDKRWFDGSRPVLGICYGMQLMAHLLGGRVTRGTKAEYGPARLRIINGDSEFLPSDLMKDQVWMSHGDHVETLPQGFHIVCQSEDNLNAVICDPERKLIGLQYHPEVMHTTNGRKLVHHFLSKICAIGETRESKKYLEKSEEILKNQMDKLPSNSEVICALSGGVDSTVAATLVSREIGDRLHCIFVDTGLLRKDEFKSTLDLYKSKLKLNVHPVDASELFLGRLQGITDPEQKRKIIGKTFIDVFESESKKYSNCKALVQGTIASDVIESSHSSSQAQVIKSHHNVGGLPEKMNMSLVEPLRHLFKDEVRSLGRELGIPEDFIRRHPFPGPGLALRVLGEITRDRLALLREVDKVLIDQLKTDDLYDSVWQAFAVLLPVKSVGVKGDGRSYDSVVALRCVGSTDGMTADWSRLPLDFLAAVSRRITNEVPGISRVVYDITSKPPATIEWE